MTTKDSVNRSANEINARRQKIKMNKNWVNTFICNFK